MRHDRNNSTILKIEGMHCASCQAPIERALKAVPGIGEININLADREVYVEGAVTDDVLSQLSRKLVMRPKLSGMNLLKTPIRPIRTITVN